MPILFERIVLEIIRSEWGFWITHKSEKIAAILKAGYEPKGVDFVTPDSFGLQVAVMKRPTGFVIPSHFHLPVPRALIGTQEVLFIQKGSLRADLYTLSREYLCSVNLGAGDLIILNSGGHGFVASEDCLFFEVKQGPFVEGKDKEVFSNSVGSSTEIRLIE